MQKIVNVAKASRPTTVSVRSNTRKGKTIVPERGALATTNRLIISEASEKGYDTRREFGGTEDRFSSRIATAVQ